MSTRSAFVLGSALAAALVAAPQILAQAQESLFFVAGGGASAEKTLSGSAGTTLGTLHYEDTAVVTPGAGPYSAETYLSQQNWNTLLGDRNCDGIVWQNVLTHGIDALDFCDKNDARNCNLYMSISQDLPATAALPAILDGDIFSIRPNGQVRFLLTENQIRTAFGIAGGVQFDVDAFAHDDFGNLFLSFAGSVTIGGVVVDDGAILVMPAIGLSFVSCQTVTVAANTGFVLYTEPQVDAMVAHSLISDPTGAAVVAIGDLEGLDADDGNGPYAVALPVNYPKPEGFNGNSIQVYHLRFCGDQLLGGGLLSTAFGGTIAQMNGVPLGSPAPALTDGSQVGLAPASGSLFSIASVDVPKPVRFTLDTGTNVLAPGGPFVLDWNGAAPNGLLFLGVTANAIPALVCNAPASSLLKNLGHCMIFTTPTIGPIMSSAVGAGHLSFAIPVGPPPGLELTIQAFTALGPFNAPALSGAVTVHY